MKRARFIIAVFLATALAAACAPTSKPSIAEPSAASTSSAGWMMYQFAPHHNAVFDRPGFRYAWVFDSGAKINGGMAIVGNTLLFDTFDKDVIALDARTGKLIWRTRLNNVVMSTPIVANGLVYVGSGANGPLAHQANLMLRIAYHRKVVWGVPGGDEVVALDLKTGSPRWRFHTIGEDMPSPVYDRGRIFFANGDRHAYALRADDGSELWHQDIGGVSTMASATIAAGNVLVAQCADGIKDSNMVALNLVTGKIAWRSSYGHCDASPAYAEGKVFTADVEPSSMRYVGRTVVAALEAASGTPVWAYRSKSLGIWTTLASAEAAIAGTYDDGTYYQAAPLDDQFLAFDARTGKVRWSIHTAGPVKQSAVIKNGRVYVGDTVGIFYVIDAKSGKIISVTPWKNPFTTSPPVIVGDTLFVVIGEQVRALPLRKKK